MFFIGVLISSFSQASAQVAMTRSIFVGDFIPITVLGGATAATAAQGDDAFAAALPIGFSFGYTGSSYTSFGVSSNGWMSFTAIAGTAANTNLFATTAPNATLAPWFDDLTSSEILYQTSGTPGSQITIVQWTSLSYYTGSTKTIQYQVWLYEGTNVIEFYYGAAPTGTGSNSESASIGIENATGGNNQYIDAVSGSSFISNSTLQATRWPSYCFRFTPGAPSVIAGGNYTVGAGQTYPNLNEAVAELNHKGISGPVTLTLTDAQYDITPAGGSNFFPVLVGPVTGLNVSNPLTITKIGTPAIIQYAGTTAGSIGHQVSATAISGTTAEPIIGLIGADYVTLNNLDIRSTEIGTSDYGVGLYNSSTLDGATNNIIQNVTVTMNRGNTSSRGFASAVPSTPASALGANSLNTFRDFTIKNVYGGIQLSGNAAFPDVNNSVGTSLCTTFNTIGDPSTANDIGNSTTQTYGIRAANQSGINIFNNSIRNVTNTGGTADGIFVETFQGTSSVYNNKVQGVRNSGIASTTSISGIRSSHTVTGTHTLRIYNNAVSEITSGYTGAAIATRTLKGIHISGTGGTTTQLYQIYNNSVSIDGSASPNLSSACFEVGTSSGPVYNLGNNIFANFTATQAGIARHFGLVSTSATLLGAAGTVSNNNDIFVANDAGVTGFAALGNATTYTTVANWTTATTLDAVSLSLNPSYLSNTSNLHSAAVGLNATGVAPPAFVTNDLDCALRTPDNDMGAYILTACVGVPTAGLISGASAVCSNLSTTLTLAGASSEAGTSYQWASSNTPGGPYGTLMGTGLTQNTGALTTPTYYTVTVTCSVSGLSAISNEQAISVNALPTVSVSPTTGLICLPGGASIPLTAAGNATTYTWSPVNGLSATTGTSTVASPTSTTTYVVTGVDAVGCISTASSVITVAQNPIMTSLTATPNAVCLGGSSQLNASAVLPALLISEVTVFRTGTGSTAVYPAYATGQDLVEISNITAGALDISGYTLSAYANDNGVASHTVTFPIGTIIPGNSVVVVCIGTGTDDLANRYFNTGGTSDFYSSAGRVGVVLKNGTAVVDAVGTGGSLTGSYTFNAGTGVTVGDFSGFAPNASGLAGTRRTVSVDNNLGTDWTASGAANLQTIGTYDAIYNNPGTISYSWTPATFLDNIAIANPLASGIIGTTAYTVTATSSSTCSTTGIVTVSQGAQLTSTTSASPNAAICAGTNVTLQATPIDGGAPYTYAWSGPNAFTSTIQNPILTAVTALEDGIYTVIISDNCGSTSTSTVTLTVNPLPIMGVTPLTALYCAPGTPVTMTASGASTYSWSPATGLSATTGITVDASPATNTVYTVTGTSTFGCISTASATINNSVSVTMSSVTATPSTICNGENSVLAGTAVLNSPSSYCQATYSSGTGFGDYISSVSLNTLLNTSVGSATPYYTLYPQAGTTTTTLVAGNTYTLTLVAGTYTDNDLAAWIDYNQNGVLDDAGEKLGETDNLGASPLSTSFTFTVPLTANNGSLRFRVREMDHSGTNDITPCTVQSSYGETEDYIITVTGGVDPLSYAWSPSTFLSSINTATTTVTAATTTTAYALTVTSAGGCIATGTTTVTVNQPTTSAINPVNCVTYTSPDGSVYTTSGTYVNVIPNVLGCDSTITINLTIKQPTTSTIAPTVCDTYTSPNGSVYTASGTYVNVIPNAVGCDSTITINLTVNYSTSSTLNPIVCDSYTSPDGSVYTASGMYMNTIPNAAGCDSNIMIMLSVYGSSTSTLNPVVCNTYTSPDGSVYTASGMYMNTIPNFIGCDSIITINLTVNYTPAVFAGNDLTVCQNGQANLSGTGASTYTWDNGITNGVSFVVIGTTTYTVTGTSAAGCIATDAVTITAIPVPTVDAGTNITQCGDQNVTLNGSGALVYTWNNGVLDGVAFNSPNGTTSYIVTGVDTYGCSNTDIVNVTVNAIPVATITAVDALTLTASPSNESYQWIDCATNAEIVGATNPTFNATQNGSYAVIVTSNGGCVDTSACAIVDEVGFDVISNDKGVFLYPNPTNGDLFVTLSEIEFVDALIYDAQGKLISEINGLTNGSMIDLKNVETGVYMIHMKSADNTMIQRVVKN